MNDKKFIRYVSPAMVSLGKTRVEYTIAVQLQGGRLSLCGLTRGFQGQSFKVLRDPGTVPVDGISDRDLARLHWIWRRYHLNDMVPGTPQQMRLVRPFWDRNPNANYDDVCRMLEENNLLTDSGYKFGSAWRFEEVPGDVLRFLFSLPGFGATWQEVADELLGLKQVDLDTLFSLITS